MLQLLALSHGYMLIHYKLMHGWHLLYGWPCNLTWKINDIHKLFDIRHNCQLVALFFYLYNLWLNSWADLKVWTQANSSEYQFCYLFSLLLVWIVYRLVIIYITILLMYCIYYWYSNVTICIRANRVATNF